MSDQDDDYNMTAIRRPGVGEQVWAPSGPARVAVQVQPVPVGPAPERRDMAGEVLDMVETEVGLIHPVLENVIAPVTGEPISTALGLFAMALELIEMGQSNLPPTQPQGAAQGRPAEQIWGPAAGAAVRECCRGAAERRHRCWCQGPAY